MQDRFRNGLIIDQPHELRNNSNDGNTANSACTSQITDKTLTKRFHLILQTMSCG